MSARLLVLAIDAASPELLEELAAAGALPAIAAILERGAVARTRGIEGLFVGATWPSLATGVGPARHGIHYLAQIPVGRTEYEAVAGWPERVEPFWARLSHAGRRLAILDVPLSRIHPGLNGVQTVEWGGHDSLYGFRTWPAALEHEVTARFGSHPQIGSCDAPRTTAADYEAFVQGLVAGATVKEALTREVLGRSEWDLLVQVFTEAHCAGHQCWHLHEPTHPAHDPGIADEVGDPLLRVLQAIDAAIAGIVADAPDATVLLLAPHGMGHAYGAQLLLPEILFRLGAAVPSAEAARRRSRWWSIARRGWRSLPASARERLRGARTSISPTGPQLPKHVANPQRSLCFPVANGLAVGGIRLNLVGREPNGTLAPDAAAAFMAELADDLLAVVDPATGRRLIRRVVPTADIHDGPALDLLPDLLVEWNDNGPTSNTVVGSAEQAVVAGWSPKIGSVSAVNTWGRTGEHRPSGLVAAAGVGIEAGRLPDRSLLDVAPTIAAVLGVDLPGVDGHPIDEFVPRCADAQPGVG